MWWKILKLLKIILGTFLVVQWLRLLAPNAGGLGSTPGQGTRSHMLQCRSKIPCATTKTLCSQINKNFKIIQKILRTLKNANQWMLILHNNRTSPVVQWIRICLPTQGHGFDAWSRKIPLAMEQRSLCVTTTQPACCMRWACALVAELCNKKSHRNEKPVLCNKD